jgi:hypothetical protein
LISSEVRGGWSAMVVGLLRRAYAALRSAKG